MGGWMDGWMRGWMDAWMDVLYRPEKGWNESQRLFCDSRMSGTEPTNDPMVRNGNIALLAKWAVEPKTRL